MSPVRAEVAVASVLSVLFCIAPMVFAENEDHSVDWPGWRGPARDGITTEKGWTTSWAAGGPRKLWDVNVGEGFSSFAVVDGKAFTMGVDSEQENHEVVLCLDGHTGKTLWAHRYATRKKGGPYPGPRATPSVSDGVLYSISRDGRILALGAEKGNLLWEKKDVRAEFRPATTQYAFCGSPMVLGKWVIFDVGPLVAFDRKTGELAWKAKNYACGHSSPVAFRWNGRTCVTTLSQPGLVVVDAADGSEIAFAAWSRHINACTPMPIDGGIFVESSSQVGSALVRLEPGYRSTRKVTVFPGMEASLESQLGPKATSGPARHARSLPTATQAAWKPFPVVDPIHGVKIVYETRNMTSQFQNCVIYGGYAYGYHQASKLRCMEVKTGKVMWDHGKVGRECPLIVADGKIIMIVGRKLDTVLIAEASPAGYRELAKAKIDAKIWKERPKPGVSLVATTPVLSGGRLFLRWGNGRAICLDLRPDKGVAPTSGSAESASGLVDK